jgi:hypothetical protein
MVAAYFPEVASYMQMLETRPAVQKVAAGRAVALAEFFSKK